MQMRPIPIISGVLLLTSVYISVLAMMYFPYWGFCTSFAIAVSLMSVGTILERSLHYGLAKLIEIVGMWVLLMSMQILPFDSWRFAISVSAEFSTALMGIIVATIATLMSFIVWFCVYFFIGDVLKSFFVQMGWREG